MEQTIATFVGLMANTVVDTVKSHDEKVGTWEKFMEAYSSIQGCARELLGEKYLKETEDVCLVLNFGDGLVDLATDIIECKAAFNTLPAPTEGEEFDCDLALQDISGALSRRKHLGKVLDQHISGAPANVVKLAQVDALVQYGSSFLEEKHDALVKAASSCQHGLKKQLAIHHMRLMKVSGGTDNSKSWKEGVSDDATLEQMKEPLAILEKAYGAAILKRIRAALEVPSRRTQHVWDTRTKAFGPPLANLVWHDED